MALGLCVALLLLGATGHPASAQGRGEEPHPDLAHVQAERDADASARTWQRGVRSLNTSALVKRTAVYFACVGFYGLAAALLLFSSIVARGMAPLALAAYSLLLAVHTAAASGSLPYAFAETFDDRNAAHLESISFLLVNGAVAVVLWTYFRDAFYPEARGWHAAANTAVVGVAAGSSIVLSILHAAELGGGGLLQISGWISMPLIVVAAALGVRALRSGRRADFAAALGLALLILGVMHDVLLSVPAGTDRPFILPFLSLGFVGLAGVAASQRALSASTHARPDRDDLGLTETTAGAPSAAQAVDLARAEFVTSITHELRTPLTSMMGYIQLLRDELEDHLTEPQAEFLTTLEFSGERLLNLVNDLLHLARLESGRTELEMVPTDLAHITRIVLAELYPLAREKGLYLRSEIDTDDAVVVADEQWIELVLSNLVSNAVKYTREGGVIVRITEERIGKRPAVAVHVIDTGLGISPAFMPRLFDRFTREEDAQQYAPTGTGLGLTISREVLVRMGGEIRVRSAKDEGSTFTILLPRPSTDARRPGASNQP